jgi:hypothetical protein
MKARDSSHGGSQPEKKLNNFLVKMPAWSDWLIRAFAPVSLIFGQNNFPALFVIRSNP